MAVYQVANKQDAFTAKVTDRKADVVMAAWNAAEALESTDYMWLRFVSTVMYVNSRNTRFTS